MRPTVASFFSGIGGLDLGFSRAGFDITVQREIDLFCSSILQKHWPDVPRFLNIKEMTNANVPFSDVWMGGFPCQDISLARAGKRAGLKGAKSGLFYDFARLLGEGRPRIVVLENVHGLLHSHKGRDFETVIRTLAEFGYSVGWRVLNSKNFGVPNRASESTLLGVIETGKVQQKYFLSPSAAKGMLRRAKKMRRNLFPPLKKSLEILADRDL